nr:MAG TPA: hypothetical protein [Caudoviricetes sp.]DAY63421.1 MAG TPA: hypothetical protein [Caudoviricetes sp.]
MVCVKKRKKPTFLRTVPQNLDNSVAFFGRSKNNFENFNFQFLIAKLTFHRYPHIRLGEVPLV